MKISPEKENLDRIGQAVESVISNLASEVRISFDYYESQGASSVGKIFLSGGGSLFYSLKDNLKHVLGIDIDYWDVTKRIKFAPGQELEKIKSSTRQFAVALGLAMR